jgi:hypothetical protein
MLQLTPFTVAPTAHKVVPQDPFVDSISMRESEQGEVIVPANLNEAIVVPVERCVLR